MAVALLSTAKLSDETAKAHFRAGTGYYRAGRFAEAGDEFMKSYELSKRPELLFNAYVAYRDVGDDKKAASALRGYLDSEKKIDDRTNLQARLQTLETRLAALEERDRALNEKEAEAEAARQAAKEAEAKNSAALAGTGESKGAGLGPWILIGAGGAAIVGGVITGLITNSKVSDIEKNCPNDLCPGTYDLDEESGSAESMAAVTDVLFIGGAAMAAGGLIWYLLDQPTESDQSASLTPPASVYCTADGCGAFVRGSF